VKKNERNHETQNTLARVQSPGWLGIFRGDKTIHQIGQVFNVHPIQVGLWKKAIQEQAPTLFEGKRGLKITASHHEPDHLFSEIGRLTMEWDWLNN